MSGGAGRPGPPRLALWLVARLVPAVDREPVIGDVVEGHAERVEAGEWGAAWWCWRQVGSLAVRAPALRRLGRPAVVGARENRKDGAMSSWWQDVRLAGRSIRKRPGFALVVAATLALGIGANTMVFSVVDGVVLNPFPFPESDRLVGVGTQFPRFGGDVSYIEHMSPAEYQDIAEGAGSIERVVAWDMGNRQVTFGEVTENLFSAFWFGDAFPTLGVQPVLGRGFTAEEIRRRDRVAVLSHRVWSGRFGADRSLVGGTVLMNGEPYTVVGIMPPRTLIYGTDLWLPMFAGAEEFARNRRQFQVLGRLAPGATLAQANAELATLAGRVEREFGGQFEEYAGWRMQAATFREINVGRLRPAALILLGAVSFVLLLVCVNVASLLLGRGAARQREVAVRSALGAGRRRILRQLLTESVMLALAGGLLGVALGWVGVRAMSDVVLSLSLPIPGGVEMNLRVLGFTALVSVAAGLAFGAVPAVHASRSDLQRALQAESQAVAGSRSRMRLQRVFVGLEVALALTLLAGSGLLVNSFLNLRRVDTGFDARNVLTMRLTLAWQRYEAEQLEPFFMELRERVGAIPGVAVAATASQFPPRTFSRSRLRMEDQPAPSEEALPVAFTTLASPGYFEALRIPILRGRGFTEADREDAPWVAVINEEAARRFFPGEDALGRRFRIGDSPSIEVVGIARATHNRGLDVPPEPEVFASTLQARGLNNQMFLLIRTRSDPRAVLPAVREAVRSIDPQQPVYLVLTLEEAVAQTQATRRLSMVALLLFAGFALLLAGVGIYGVAAYAVSQRTREIGVRIALGAEGRQVRRMVLRQALLPVGLGVAAGLAAALGVGRLMSGLLFGVGGGDPATLLAAAALLAGAAVLASYLPAWRASRLDPVRALRLE